MNEIHPYILRYDRMYELTRRAGHTVRELMQRACAYVRVIKVRGYKGPSGVSEWVEECEGTSGYRNEP